MEKFKVTAVMEVEYETYIEARNSDEAYKKAEDLKLEDFEKTDDAYFRIYDLWEINKDVSPSIEQIITQSL